MNETKAATNMRNSRLMQPVRDRWAFLVIFSALVAAGAMGSIITQNIRILLACIIGAPVLAIIGAFIMSGFSILVTRLSSVGMGRRKPKGS